MRRLNRREFCTEIGKVPEKTYKGTFNVRVPVTLHKEASLFAAVHNIPRCRKPPGLWPADR